MSILIKNIKELLQTEQITGIKRAEGKRMSELPVIKNAFLHIKGQYIENFGTMDELPKGIRYQEEIDADGHLVMPAFCDSHTHIVYAGSREQEFIDKIKGLTYEEIAKRGGGILNSAKLLQNTSEEELIEQALERLDEIMHLGTGAVEIKSGYGLTLESELKMLRVIRKLKSLSPLTIRANFLGAHSIPLEYRGKQEEYVDIVINKMLPVIAQEKLADFVDVFCDKGFFTIEDTDRILNAASKYGLRGKIHANELGLTGGVQIGVKHKALSVDHLEYIEDDEIKTLLNSDTMPTVLPGAAFFLNLPLSPIRKMIDAGLPICLASDYNPGSSPSGNLQFIMSLGAVKYKMLPEEIINAITINGAYAMGVNDILGTIKKGKIANVIITKKMNSYNFLPYAFGSNKVAKVILNGKIY